jgi:hypothetical protein
VLPRNIGSRSLRTTFESSLPCGLFVGFSDDRGLIVVCFGVVVFVLSIIIFVVVGVSRRRVRL